MKKTFSVLMLILLLIGMFTLALNIQPVKASGTVGVKAGDWIKCTYTISGWPSGTPYPEWLKVEFLSIEGTNATIRVTMRMSDGTEQSDTLTVDVAGDGETFQGLSGFVIPANRTIGDSIYITGYGNVTIAGETTSSYAGASRTVVYASFSQHGTQLTYYWDKQTGVMVEASVVSGSVTATAKATETNMWQAETIYIRADGSIDPPDAPISTVDNVTYTLTGNITGTTDGIVVERSNIIIDGAGYTVEGTGAVYSKGMSLSRITNVTIKNTNIKHFEYGIGLYYSSNNIISGNNITANTVDGIWLGSSLGNSISGNTIANNGFGILLYDSSNYNSVSGNNITANYQFGIGFGLSSNNIISGNNITNSGYGIILEDCLNNIISGNNITNSDSGIRLSNSSNNGIFENTLTYGSDGIVLYDSSNYNVISGNKITNNSAGIWLSFSSNNNSISANSVIYNDDGVHLYRSSNNTIYHNNFINNTRQVSFFESGLHNDWDDGYPSGGNYWSDYVGVDLYRGPYQNETGSDGIGDTVYFIYENNADNYPLMGPWTRIGENVTVTHASGVSLTFANVMSSGITTINKIEAGPEPPSGFKLATETPTFYEISTTANYSEAIQISISYNDIGLTEEEENGLKLLHWNETLQQWEDITTLVDTINNVIYGETNHLSTFAIVTPLIHDNAIIIISKSKNIVGQGFTAQINVTIKNHGDYPEAINVTLYANSIEVANFTSRTLSQGASVTIPFTWNTSGFAKGNYTIWAYALPVPGETDTGDNTFIDGWVFVGLVGDVNADGIVDIEDIYLIALAYGTMPGQPGYNPNLDINCDGIIDIEDIYIAALHYGEHYP